MKNMFMQLQDIALAYIFLMQIFAIYLYTKYSWIFYFDMSMLRGIHNDSLFHLSSISSLVIIVSKNQIIYPYNKVGPT